MKAKKFLIVGLLMIFFILNFGCGIANTQDDTNSNEVKNVIIMIGDGMGLGHVQVAQWYHVGAYEKLNMQKMPVVGLVSTISALGGVTDSAAAATALATGSKTRNGVVGINIGKQKVKNIMEAAREAGKSTGLVVTSEITDATPAAFSAHQQSRSEREPIAESISKCGAEVIFGGGRQHFLPKSEGGERTDDRNLLKEMEENKYTIVTNKSEMENVTSGKVIGLFRDGNLSTPYPEDASGLEPTLEQMTVKAIEMLSSNSNGFVLMVEGSKIDKVASVNDTKRMINETILFDNAIKAAVEFAEKDGDTLVVVTGDHETGGVLMPENPEPYKERIKEATWTTKEHTISYIMVYAYGPGSMEFTGVIDNTDIPKKLATLMGLKDFPRILGN